MTNDFMKKAIELSYKAKSKGEIPVGAIVVKNGKIIGEGYNTRETGGGVLGHAEIEAIKKATKTIGDWRLDGCDLYVTMEPCPMCAGAIINSRISRVFFGAYDNKWGSFGSLIDLSAVKYQTKPEIHGGIMEAECKQIIESFFKNLRN